MGMLRQCLEEVRARRAAPQRLDAAPRWQPLRAPAGVAHAPAPAAGRSALPLHASPHAPGHDR